MSDNEYDEDDVKNGFEDEVNAFERAGLRGGKDILLNSLKGEEFRDINSKDQFYIIVNAVFNKLLELEISFINDNDLKDILDYADNLEKPGYKNALSYILGFYASSYGNKINSQTIKMIWEEFPRITSHSVEYPIFNIKKHDVLRYARLWLKIKLHPRVCDR